MSETKRQRKTERGRGRPAVVSGGDAMLEQCDRLRDRTNGVQRDVVRDLMSGSTVEMMVEKYGLPREAVELVRDLGLHMIRQNELIHMMSGVRDSDLLEKAMFTNIVSGVVSSDANERFRWQGHFARLFPLEYRDGMRRQMYSQRVMTREGVGEVEAVGSIDSKSGVFEIEAEIERFEDELEMDRKLAEEGL